MLRKITKSVGKFLKEGELRDYPKHVWQQIERDALKADKSLKSIADFSEEIPTNSALQSVLKGRKPTYPERAGAARK